jgi:hypothetical protein
MVTQNNVSVKQCKLFFEERGFHNVFDDRLIKLPIVKKNHQNMHP